MAPKKAVTVTATIAGLWLLATTLFLPVLISQLQAPAPLSGLTLALGTAICVALISFQIKKELRKIEQQETNLAFANFRMGRALAFTFVIWIALMALVLLGSYIAYYQPFWIFLVNLLIPFPPAMSLTAAVYYWRWQRKNKQTLYIVNGKLSLSTT